MRGQILSIRFLSLQLCFQHNKQEENFRKTKKAWRSFFVLRWLRDYFSKRSQYFTLHKRRLSPSLNSQGVLKGANMSPALFHFYADSIRSLEISLLVKYADEFAVLNRHIINSDHEKIAEGADDCLQIVRKNNLFLNFAKCNFCVSSLNRNLIIGVQELDQLYHVDYLLVMFYSLVKWSMHINFLFSKCLRRPFYNRSLGDAGVSNQNIVKFVNLCIISIEIHASPVIFGGLLL